ncbi:MAG: HAMP domain-containing histidine kinase [Anaerolineae bacterium]|nr:HAMP domain-containing histidine kinase [Anaerolineae bacterium]
MSKVNNWLTRISLGTKLTLSLLVVLLVFLILSTVLLVSSTQSFTKEVGDERILDAIEIIQNSLTSIQDQIRNDINFLVSDVSFFQAVGRRDVDGLNAIIDRTGLAQGFYNIDIVDGDGSHLLNPERNDDIDQRRFLERLTDQTSVTVEIEEIAGQTAISISGAARVVSATGNILGAIQISRQIDDEFLQLLVSGQSRVSAALLYNGEFIAQNTQSRVNNASLANVDLEEAAISQPPSDATVIVGQINLADNTPYSAAFVPISADSGLSSARLLILADLFELYNFQSQLQTTTIGGFVLLIVAIVGLIYFLLYQSALKPIDRLRALAQDMTSGQYTKRIPVYAHDELGQLSITFNEMADAIQQREVSLQAARERAETADQVKSTFLASMSHELRTPLNAIINFSKFVAKGDLGPVNEEQEETLYEVVDSGLHLLNLINDVLDMSKIESGSLTLFVVDDVDLGQLIKQAMSTGKTLLQDKPVQLTADIASDLPRIRGDRQRIMQVLLNIMSNACKFTSKGSISVSAYSDQDDVLIAIADTGPGIAPEDFGLVFEAFKQTTAGLRQGGGSGLGMPITKSLVEAHGGQIRLESEVGAGTTFTVTLPISSKILSPTLA